MSCDYSARAAALCALLGAACAAPASIIPQSESRSLMLAAGVTGTSPDSDNVTTAPGNFEAFKATEDLFFSSGGALGNSTVSQQSSAIDDGATTLSGTGGVITTGTSSFEGDHGSASGTSRYAVVFDLAEATDYELDWTLGAQSIGPGTTTLVSIFFGPMTELGVPEVDDSYLDTDVQVTDSMSGTLAPGTYRLELRAAALLDTGESGAFFESAGLNWSFDLLIPTPGSALLAGAFPVLALRRRR